MRRIKLTHGAYAFIDDEDFNKLSKNRWHLTVGGYVRSAQTGNNSKKILMHREIMGAKKGQFIDHINGNPLDNRKENLRFCTHAENRLNNKMPITNSTGFKGIYFQDNKWTVRIKVRHKQIYLGRYSSKLDAAKAYQLAAHNLLGAFARGNT